MINSESLLKVMNSIRPRPDHDQLGFVVRPLPGGEGAGWIGRNSHSGVAFLIVTQGERHYHPAVSLPLIRVRHGIRVAIDDGRNNAEVTVSLLECLAHDGPTIELFVRTVGGILTDDAPADQESVGNIVERLINLFRDYSHAGDAEILGLWAELLLIAHCPNPAQLARLWRSHTGSRYDFGSDTERLDVKATTSVQRHHELASSQVTPPPGVDAAFVSVMTEQVSRGTSVGALWDQVLRLAPESQARIDAQCIRTLGRDWQVARETNFDLAKALSTIEVYAVSDVPRIADLPAGVIRARFTSDFSMGLPWQGAPPTPDGPIAAALTCCASYRD